MWFHLYRADGRVGDGLLRDGRPPDGVAAGAGAVRTVDSTRVVTGLRRRSSTRSPTPIGLLTVESALSALRSEGVPAAVSVHPSAVPDDPQVVARELLRRYRHPAAGRFVQVGLPLSLSVDAPAVKGPAPTPAPVRRRIKKTATASAPAAAV